MKRMSLVAGLALVSLSCASSGGPQEGAPPEAPPPADFCTVVGEPGSLGAGQSWSPEMIDQQTEFLLSIPGLYDDDTVHRLETAAKYYRVWYNKCQQTPSG